jgi:AcrR family transcriptional regulator
VRIARTSRRNYYEHFEDRDACFLALFDAINDATMARIADAVNPGLPWEKQVDVAVGAFLDSVSARPALFSSFARELPALGRAGAERQRAVIERFAELLVGLVESGRRSRPDVGAHALSADTAILIVGGLRELTLIALEDGRDPAQLRAVTADAVKAILKTSVLSG